LAGSDAPATLYRTAPYLANVPPRLLPSMDIHPDDVGALVLLLNWAMLTIMTSPWTTPVGLLIVRVVVLVVDDVAVPLWVMLLVPPEVCVPELPTLK